MEAEIFVEYHRLYTGNGSKVDVELDLHCMKSSSLCQNI